FFMDFYKSNCRFSYSEKLELIEEIICRKDIKEVLSKSKHDDISTKLLELILRTNNCRFILLSAKILTIKRALR
ncbi:hypothetical protein V7111_27225, partial [Neobacillus niacini]|uniref:hypothetical protein n=1 Tax=Neobacillus niacini TaxID=86668 RepID=UPI00300151AF